MGTQLCWQVMGNVVMWGGREGRGERGKMSLLTGMFRPCALGRQSHCSMWGGEGCITSWKRDAERVGGERMHSELGEDM